MSLSVNITILFLILIPGSAYSQRYDYVWPMGYDAPLQLGWGQSRLSFLNGVKVTAQYETRGYDFQESSSICGPNGQLLFYSNGCDIRNHQHAVLPNASVLINDDINSEYCKEYANYPGHFTTLFLPDLSDTTHYLHVQKNMVISETDIFTSQVWLHHAYNKPNGDQVLGNVDKILKKKLKITPFQACLHQDKKRWWLVFQELLSNTFQILLLGTNGVEEVHAIPTGPILSNNDMAYSQISFSPDGKTMVFNADNPSRLFVFDFNPQTGNLAFRDSVVFTHSTNSLGTCFSPNGRFVYVSLNEGNIYQVDLQQGLDTFLLGNVTGIDETNWPIANSSIYPGPDCRLYISPGSTTFYLHTIHQPDLKGLACQLEKNAIRAPTRVLFHLHHRPNYLALRGCDPSIPWKIVSSTPYLASKETPLFSCSPNPAQDLLWVHCTQEENIKGSYQYAIVNLQGQLVLQGALAPQAQQSIAVDALPPGMYQLMIASDGLLVQAEKIMILRP